MKPVESWELSALLDGELPPARADEVREAIEKDPALAGQYAALNGLDRDLKAEAEAVMFEPAVTFAPAGEYVAAPQSPVPLVLLVIGLLALRVGLKAIPAAGEITVAALVLLIVLGYGVQRLVTQSETWWSTTASEKRGDSLHATL